MLPDDLKAGMLSMDAAAPSTDAAASGAGGVPVASDDEGGHAMPPPRVSPAAHPNVTLLSLPVQVDDSGFHTARIVRDAESDADLTQISNTTESFKQNDYQLKRVFAEVGAYCMGD